MQQTKTNTITNTPTILSSFRYVITTAILSCVLFGCIIATTAQTSYAWATETSNTQSTLQEQKSTLTAFSTNDTNEENKTLSSSYSSGASVNGTHYTNIQQAWSKAYNLAKQNKNVVFDLYQNWLHVKTSGKRTYLGEGDGFKDGHLVVPHNGSITICLHGHMINKAQANSSSSYSKSGGEVIHVESSGNLIVYGGDNSEFDEYQNPTNTGRSVLHEGFLLNGPNGVRKNVWRPSGKTQSEAPLYGGTITGGYSTNGAGGIHLETSANLTMYDVNLVGNMSDFYFGDGDGGALYLMGNNKVTLNKCNIDNNYAQSTGGALFIYGNKCKLEMHNTTMNDNFAYGYFSRGGGAICADDNCRSFTAELDNSQMCNNQADRSGGAIYANSGKLILTLTNGSFIDNNKSDDDAGAVYANEGIELNLSDSSISNNISADKAGAIYADGDNCSFVFTNSLLNNNTAADFGGCFYVDNKGARVTATNTNVNGNSTNDDGGAFYFNSDVSSFTFTNSTLNNNGAGRDTVYGSSNGGAVYADGYLNATFVNSKIADNFAHDNGGVVYLNARNSSLQLNNSITCNNSSKNNGGVAFLNGWDSKVILRKNSIINNNTAKNGGAVYLNAWDCMVQGDLADPFAENTSKESSTTSDSNTESGTTTNTESSSTTDNTDEKGSTEVNNSELANNTANENGGAIYCNNSGYSISKLCLSSNSAQCGGAIYSPAKNREADTSITNCRFVQNSTTKDGGALYTEEENITLGNCFFSNNSSKDGAGAIFWQPDVSFFSSYGKFMLNGRITINNNQGSSTEKNNLYICHSNNKSYSLECTAKNESDIHFGLSLESVNNKTATDVPISAAGEWKASVLTCDNNNYYAKWTSHASGGDRKLHVVSGTKPINNIPTMPVSINNRFMITPNAYTESSDGINYDLQTGAYNHLVCCSTFYPKAETTNTYFYSDGYFAQSASSYNEHLATMSLNLAISAMPSDDRSTRKSLDDNNRQPNRCQYVTQLLGDIGFSHIRANDGLLNEPTTDSIGDIIAKKTITLGKENNEYTLISVVTRGACYEREWVSNVTLGDSGEAQGFSSAASIIYNDIQEYLEDMGLEEQLEQGKVIFWMSGFSRGAATINLAAKRLVDYYQPEGNAIFAYTFETPSGGCDANDDGTHDYTCIHNIINASDPVAKVAPNSFGLRRYGIDHYVPGSNAGTVKSKTEKAKYANGVNYTTSRDNEKWKVSSSAYKNQVSKMLDQLELVNRNIFFDDYFSLSTVNPKKNYAGTYTGIFGWRAALITEVETGSVDLDTYYETLIDKVLESSCNQRKKYTENLVLEDSNKTKHTFASIQETARWFMILARCLDDTSSARLTDCVSNTLSQLPDGLGTSDIYFIAQKWNTKSENEKYTVLTQIWDVLVKSKSNGKKFMDYIPEDVRDEDTARNCTITLLNMAFNIACYDYNNNGNDIFEENTFGDVSSDYFTLIGTLLNQSDNLLHHNEFVCLSWMRSYDSFYDPNKEWDTDSTTNTLKANGETDAEYSIKDFVTKQPQFVDSKNANPTAWSISDDGTIIELDISTFTVLSSSNNTDISENSTDSCDSYKLTANEATNNNEVTDECATDERTSNTVSSNKLETNSLSSGTRLVIGDNTNAGAINYYSLDGGEAVRFNERPIDLEDGSHTLKVWTYEFDNYASEVTEYKIEVGNHNKDKKSGMDTIGLYSCWNCGKSKCEYRYCSHCGTYDKYCRNCKKYSCEGISCSCETSDGTCSICSNENYGTQHYGTQQLSGLIKDPAYAKHAG